MDYDKLKGREAVPYGRLSQNMEGPLEPPFYYSAFGIAVKHGFQGTEEEWLASLTGPAGAKGDPGAGITDITVNDDDSVTITYADGQEVTTDPIQGAQGEPGVSPTVDVSAVSGGHKVVVTDAGGSETFYVMDGANGSNGTNGQNGISPSVSVTTISGGHTVSITDAGGTETFNVMDGAQGQTGPTGNGIASVTLTSGDHSPGTTDTYTITFTNGTTATFSVYNGTNGTGFSFEVVQSLPSTGAANTIYLLPNSGSAPNIYDEYIWTTAWEKLGTTEFTQKQSDWNVSDSTDAAYIKNKPTIPAGLPPVTASDNGKFLRVVNGAWAAASLPAANGVTF